LDTHELRTDANALLNHELSHVKRSSQLAFVLGRPDDIVLCVGSGISSSLGAQLRRKFNDTAIKDVPEENVGTNGPELTVDSLSPEVKQALEEELKDEYDVWNKYCGTADPKAKPAARDAGPAAPEASPKGTAVTSPSRSAGASEALHTSRKAARAKKRRRRDRRRHRDQELRV